MVSVGGFLGTAMPGLSESVTSGLAKRGGHPREFRMNSAALAVGITFILLAVLMFAVCYSPLFYSRRISSEKADLMLGMNKRCGIPPGS